MFYMPRGVRKQINYDDELMKIDAQMTKWKNTISELEDQKKSLIQQKEQTEMSELYQFIKQSGKTPNEILAELTPNKAKSDME